MNNFIYKYKGHLNQTTIRLFASLLFFASFTLHSQNYKTITINRDADNKGTIENLSFPESSPAFTFFVKTNTRLASQKNATILRNTNKIVLFRINLKDYNQNEQLFVRFNNQFSINNDLERPLISAFYDTNSIVRLIPEKYCSYNHDWLNTEQQISVKVDTTRQHLYVVIAFPNSFGSGFTYSILCKTKTIDAIAKYDYGAALYRHPYDYKKQPSFFMESWFMESWSFEPHYSYPHINLNDPAFEKPHLKEGSDSLFYNKWMLKFIELAEKDTALTLYCDYPFVKVEMHFDTTGNLVHYQCSNIDNLTTEEDKMKSSDYLRLLNQSFPYEYTWTPALDYDGRAIEYTKTIMFTADFCWN